MTGTRRPILVIAVLLLLLAGFAPPGAAASSPPAVVSINIGNGFVHESVNLDVLQNITSYQSSFVLPQFSGVLQGSNASGLNGMIQSAIEQKASSAQVGNAILTAVSTSWVNSSLTQWFNVSLGFDLRGVQTDRSGTSQIDVGWKSFSLGANLTLGGYEVNNIGARYLVDMARQVSSSIPSSPNSPIRFQFLVNGHTLLPSTFPSLVRGVELLNFTTINTPVSKWTLAYDSNNNLITWSFKGFQLGAEIILLTTEPGGTTRTFYGLFYRLTSKITAPLRSTATNDSIVVLFSDMTDFLMGAVVLSASVVGIVAYASERRLTAGFGKKRSKR